MPLQPEDVDLPQAPPVFPNLESLSTIQKQDIDPTTSFPVSGDTTIPPVTPEVPQQFLRDPHESLPPESSNSSGGVVVVTMPQIATPSQPQSQQSQVPLFPQDDVVLAGGNTTLQQVLEAAVAQQQLNSVLYSPTPSADSLQQHVQENMNSLRLGNTENSLSTRQQIQIQQQMQQQQQQQQQQMQQFQQHQILGNLQQQQQVLSNMQIQQQLILQPQDQQQLQQQQLMENIQQQQQQLQQNQQVLNNIQLQDQQQQNQILTNLQQHQLQQQQQQNQVLNNLQQQQQQQLQEQQVLENLQQQLQAELLQPQIHSSPQVQQPVSILQQAGELLTIQTSFPTQPPSHTSPPQQLFQSPRPLAETQSSQQVQAALLQNTLSVLTGGSLNSEQQSTGSALYLTPNPPSQQQQQLAFISSMGTSASQPQTVAIFQNQPQSQLSQLQQQSTPMEQQQSPQQNQQQPPQLPMGQQGSLFQGIQNHSQNNSVSQSQLPQPQQTGLLLCTTDLNPQAIPPAILFSTQTQGPQSSIGSISVGIPQQDPTEPMSFQDQSSSGSSTQSTDNQQQSLFQEQQPMQVGPSSGGISGSQPVELFLPQTSLSSLQSTIGSQELSNQAPAAGTTIFVVQGSVGVVANPGQQPPQQLFQTAVGGNVAPQGQASLFVFGIQNGKTIISNAANPK